MTKEILKALVIDDSATDARLLSNILSTRLQTHVEIAKDGLEGLEKLSTGNFDLAFLDLQMPRMTGTEVLKKIREWPNTINLPVIVISGNNDRETVQSLLEFKIFDFIVKPYDTSVISERLAHKLESLTSSTIASNKTRQD